MTNFEPSRQPHQLVGGILFDRSTPGTPLGNAQPATFFPAGSEIYAQGEKCGNLYQVEFGAVRIYEGQLAALRWTGRGGGEASRKIANMARAEREHRAAFDKLLARRRVRPTILSPLWSLAGFGLGAVTALMGEKAAMAVMPRIRERVAQLQAERAKAASLAQQKAAEARHQACLDNRSSLQKLAGMAGLDGACAHP